MPTFVVTNMSYAPMRTKASGYKLAGESPDTDFVLWDDEDEARKFAEFCIRKFGGSFNLLQVVDTVTVEEPPISWQTKKAKKEA